MEEPKDNVISHSEFLTHKIGIYERKCAELLEEQAELLSLIAKARIEFKEVVFNLLQYAARPLTFDEIWILTIRQEPNLDEPEMRIELDLLIKDECKIGMRLASYEVNGRKRFALR